MTSIGYATLQIIPTLDGVSSSVQKQLGFLPRLGRSAGKSLGDGLASGVDAAARQVEAATSKITAANKRVEDSAGKVRVAEAQLQSLRDRGISDAGRLAAAEEKIAAAQRNHTTAASTLTRAQSDLARAHDRANDAQNEGASSGSRFSNVLGGIREHTTGAVGDLKGLAVAAAGVGTAMAIATTSMDFQGAAAEMNASLGATGALAEKYGKDAASLYGRGFGESMTDVTEAIESVATTFPTLGSEGEVALDQAAGRALNLAKVFNIDVAEASQTAAQLITNGLAKDSTQAMDLLTTAMQRVPASLRGELPDLLSEYGKHFQTFGLTGQAAMGLIVDMAPQGQIALDKTGDAIKELSIRATDGSKLTSGAMQAIGLDANKMATAVAGGGSGAQAAMQDIARGLLTIQDPAQRAQQAIALFGTPLEDLGVDKIPQFLTALSGSSNSMAGAAGAADQLGATLNDTAQSKLTAFTRGIKTGIVEGLGSTIGFLQQNKQLIGDLGIAAGITGGALLLMAGPAVFTAIKTAVTATRTWAIAQGALNVVMNMNPLGLIVTAVAALAAGIVVAYRNSETFRNIVGGAWQWIKDAAGATVSWFTNTALPFLNGVWEGIKTGWNGLVTAAGVAWDLVTAPARIAITFFTQTLPAGLSAGWELVKLGWNSLVSSAQGVWDGVTGKFNGMVDFVRSIPGKIGDAARGMWDGIGNAFKAVVNSMIRTWNMFAGKLSFTTPDWVPGLGGKSFSIPTIAEFADGGHTGPGSKYQFAGVVHADEFVVKKSARQMLEAASPGGLDYMNTTGRWPGYAEGGQVQGGQVQLAEGLNPGADALRTLIMKKWPQITTIGGRRSEDGYGEHSSGNAIDVMIPNYGYAEGKKLGDEILAYAQRNAAALGLDGAIWHQASYGYGGALDAATPMEDRGSDTQNHMDHLHLILGKGRGANAAPVGLPQGLADIAPTPIASTPSVDPSAWSPIAAAAPSSNGAIATADGTAAPAAAPDANASASSPTAGGSGGGGGSYPTSISGWAGFIGENFVGGQIKSLLSVFGIPDSPSWMKAGSELIGGIKVSDKAGNSVFDGSNPMAAVTGTVDGKAQPAAVPAPAAPAAPGQQAPAAAPAPAGPAAPAPAVAPAAAYNGGAPATHNAVYRAFRDAGFADAMWPDYVQMVNRESSWNPEARNDSSGAYGLAQFLGQGNVDKYLGGSTSNVPVDVQAKGMMSYIKDRYGDPAKAWDFWQKNNWYADGGRVKPFLYDMGGMLPQGTSLVENRSGGPEPILTRDYWSTARSAINVATSMVKGQGGGQTKQVPQVNYTINARDTEDAFVRAQRQERERAAAKLSRY